MDYWKGKVAVITGASSGIGEQISLDLAKAGFQVVGLARRKERIAALGIHAIECDVSKLESIEAAFREIDEKYGKVHILVNNAGRGKKGSILDANVPHQEYLDTVNVNFSAAVICSREAFRLIEKHDELAYIININSTAGHGSPNAGMLAANIYGATKHAITNFTETLRLDLAHSGNKRVRVSSLSPGLVKTEIFDTAGYDGAKVYANASSLNAKDISDTVTYLLSLPENVNISEIIMRSI